MRNLEDMRPEREVAFSELLTDEEKVIIGQLALAWNKFVALRVVHPMHREEFASAIHAAQRIIMARVYYPERKVFESRGTDHEEPQG